MPLTQMSETDYALIRHLRDPEVGVLQDLEIGSIEPECTVVILCADGHRFDDKYKHAKGCCGNNLHPLTRHGGALVLAENSPFSSSVRNSLIVYDDLCLLNEIEDAMAIKQTNSLLAYAHIPCAKAASAGLTAADVLKLHVEAKDRTRHEIPKCNIRCLVHVDYNGWRPEHKRFATYFLNRQKLLQWAGTEDAASYPQLQALAA